MKAPDLRLKPPRRWNDSVGGICWLGRTIDKLRAAQAGTLGAYFLNQSPMDGQLLRQLGLDHEELAAIVAASSDDDAVLAALIARDAACVERARAWSAALPQREQIYLWWVDVDDGYVTSWLHGPVQAMSSILSWSAKRLWPSRFDAR